MKTDVIGVRPKQRSLQDAVFSSAHRVRWLTVLLFLCGATYLYLLLFIPLNTPLEHANRDDSHFLYEAMRIVEGQVIYRDFFEFNFAGTQFLYSFLMRIFGYRTWIPNACLLSLGVGLLWSSLVVSRSLMAGTAVLLPGSLFLCLAFRNYLEASHHWFSILLIMLATAILAEAMTNVRVVLVGILSGLALCFSQNHGALAILGFCIFIFWENRISGLDNRRLFKHALCLLLPFGAVVTAYMAYVIFTAGLENIVFSNIVFVVRYFGQNEQNGWAQNIFLGSIRQISLSHFRGLWRVVMTALLVPGVYLVSAGRYLFRRTATPITECRSVLLLTIVGLCLFASVVNSATMARLGTVSLPAFILLIWLSTSSGRLTRVLHGFLWIVVFILMGRDAWLSQTDWMVIFKTPSGPIALTTPQLVQYYQWLAQHTRPGDYVFDTDATGSYFRFQLRNPTMLPYLTACDFTRPDQVAAAVRDLQAHDVRFVIWGQSLDTSSCPAATDHLAPIRDYLRNNYKVVVTFPHWDRWSPEALSILESVQSSPNRR